ncbi:MAG: septum formation initiator family protein [Firmicutes bacterium]|nr:septum formation initiator family protein [Bacillota bacterium]
MAKKGKRLREFEKNNRKFNVSEASEKRAKKYEAKKSSEVKENKKKKKTKVTNVKRLITSVIMVILIAFVLVSAVNIARLTKQRDELKAYNKKLLNLKEDLVAELDHINSAEYIEQQARKDLKMIKENELLFVVEEGN